MGTMKIENVIRKMYYALQRIYEKFRGVDFVSGIASKQKNHVEYAASTPLLYSILNKYFNEMKIGENDGIMDVGCGKGRMLCFFASWPFGKVGGIEYEKDILTICRQNLWKLKVYRVLTYQGDASKFEGYDDYNYFYIFNPFHKEIMQGFIDQLKCSKEKTPRTIRVLYLNPLDGDMFVESGFELERTLQHGVAVLKL